MVAKRFTPEQFAKQVDEYLAERVANKEIPTIMHFAMEAGISREQLYKHYKVHDDYKDAYAKLEGYRDGMTEFTALNPKEGDIRNAGIMVFALKNIGWTDKQEIDHTSSDGSFNQKDHSLAVLEALKSKHKEV